MRSHDRFRFLKYWIWSTISNNSDFFPAAFELQVPSHLLEICHQIKCDIIEYAGNRKTQKLKTAILYWVQAFPRSTNALKSLTSLNVQTAVSRFGFCVLNFLSFVSDFLLRETNIKMIKAKLSKVCDKYVAAKISIWHLATW